MRNLKKWPLKLLLVLSVLLISILTGCSKTLPTRQGQINSGNIFIPTICPVLPPKNIKWKVITPNVARLLNQKIDQKEIEPYAYIALSPYNYLVFTSWLNEVLVYLKSQKATNKHILLNNKQ
ncbi:hypothetical protein GAMM_260004 [Gammaproteobacteria bacterium]